MKALSDTVGAQIGASVKSIGVVRHHRLENDCSNTGNGTPTVVEPAVRVKYIGCNTGKVYYSRLARRITELGQRIDKIGNKEVKHDK